MECLPVASVPEGPDWSYELKLDGYRLEAVRDNGRSKLFSRRGHDLTKQFPWVAGALDHLPAGTVIDGELVALARRAADEGLSPKDIKKSVKSWRPDEYRV